MTQLGGMKPEREEAVGGGVAHPPYMIIVTGHRASTGTTGQPLLPDHHYSHIGGGGGEATSGSLPAITHTAEIAVLVSTETNTVFAYPTASPVYVRHCLPACLPPNLSARVSGPSLRVLRPRDNAT